MDREQTIVLAQASGSTPVAGRASWRNNLGGDGLHLTPGSEISLSDAIIDVSGDDTAQSFIFNEDIEEEITFFYWVWHTGVSQNGKNWGERNGTYVGEVMKVQKLTNGERTDETQTYTLRIPAGKYTAESLADYVSRTTREPTISHYAARGVGKHAAVPFVNDFYKTATYVSADDTYVLTSLNDDTTQVELSTGYAQYGSSSALNLTFDTVSQKFKWGFLHTPLFVQPGGATSAPEIGIAFEKETLDDATTIIQLIAADTGIAITQWTTKASWEDSFWHRLGFTEDQLNVSVGLGEQDGFRTQAALNPSLTAGRTVKDGTNVPQPLTAAYSRSDPMTDISFAQGPIINALSPAWSIRILELPITWRRGDEIEGSIGRVTRSYSAAGFVFGQGSRSYTIEADLHLQSLTVQILDSNGAVTTELGNNNSVSLDVAIA